MAVQIVVARDVAQLIQKINALGLDAASVTARTNESGQYYFLHDVADSADAVVQASSGSAGLSYGAGSGTVEVLRKFTAVPSEVVGAISGLSASGTLASQYVLPGSVELTDSGAVGPTLIDDGNGNIVETGSLQKRGTIVYSTGVVSIAYRAGAAGTGNLTAKYEHSDLPDSADVPSQVRLKNISVLAGANVDIAIFEDAALTVPVFKGTITVASGSGMLDLGGIVSVIAETADMTKRNRRWITVSVAVTDMRLYWERVA